MGRGLDFIQKKQCLRSNALASNSLKITQNQIDIQGSKNPVHIPMPLQIQLEQIQTLIRRKKPHQRGLSNLSRSP